MNNATLPTIDHGTHGYHPAERGRVCPNARILTIFDTPIDHWHQILAPIRDQALGRKLGLNYTWREFDLKGLLKAVEAGEVDAAVLTVAEISHSIG